MDKYKVILVDDEAEVIDVIEQKIAWKLSEVQQME